MGSCLIKIKNLSISVVGGGDLICDSDFFIKPGETVCLFGSIVEVTFLSPFVIGLIVFLI